MSTATQTAFYLTALLISAVLVLSGVLGLAACLWLTLLLYLSLLLVAWQRFDGGRHPCFVFLGLLMLFQLGRLIGYALGATHDPFDVVVQTLLPIQVSAATSEILLFVVLLSGTCIYAVCAWNVRPATLRPGREQGWLAACYVLLALSFPFVLYKNYEYFQFIRSHGGYLAIFTENQDVTASAGAVARVMSVVAYDAFVLVYVLERNGRRLAWVTTAFLSTSVLELAIGLRGKVFLFLITLWFIRNVKSGKRFRLGTLAVSAIVVSFAAVAISGFREMRTTALVGPAGFIAGQGVSMGVTEIAIEDRPLFRPHVAAYFKNEVLQAYYPLSHFEQGQFFDNDLSIFLNAAAFRAGFGTGSSYLAEAWIAGGLPGVLCISVLIGLVLRWLHNVSRHWIGAVALAILLPTVVYLPRSQTLSPLAAVLKYGPMFLFVVPCLWFLRWLLDFGPAEPTPTIAPDAQQF
jgi:hypothetical protein